MILLVAIVQSSDAWKVRDRLIEQGLRLTQIHSSGGFLAASNVVLLIGVQDDRREEVLDAIRATCEVRTWYINAVPTGGVVGLPSAPIVTPLEVQVGGATVIGIPVKRFLRLRGGTAQPANDQVFPTNGVDMASASSDAQPAAEISATPNDQRVAMNLVVAVVHNDDADAVSNALVDAGHRLTRINSAGGFFRRGNATLLLGVEAQRLDAVIALIQANCRERMEPNPVQDGSPMFGATIFVLEASQFERI